MSPTLSAAESQLLVRALHDVREMQPCVDLQQQVWGYSDRHLVPDHIFVVAAKTGGQVLGAFIGETLVGFVLAFSARRDGQSYIHSHMAAVLPQYQNRGVGRSLKIAQREDALKRDIDCIEWTFDPFQLKNARFNIERLGAIVRRYLPDLYGRTGSPLHGGLPTDRLLAEWWIQSPRVVQILQGNKPNHREARRIAIPNIEAMGKLCVSRAEHMQAEARIRFEEQFQSGYAITGIEVEGETGIFILERYED